MSPRPSSVPFFFFACPTRGELSFFSLPPLLIAPLFFQLQKSKTIVKGLPVANRDLCFAKCPLSIPLPCFLFFLEFKVSPPILTLNKLLFRFRSFPKLWPFRIRHQCGPSLMVFAIFFLCFTFFRCHTSQKFPLREPLMCAPFPFPMFQLLNSFSF